MIYLFLTVHFFMTVAVVVNRILETLNLTVVEKLSRQTGLKLIVVLGIVSYALEYTWEELQCQPFFNHLPATWMVTDMIGAAIVDVATTYIMYSIIAIISKSWSWILGKWNKKQWTLMLGLSLVASVTFELLAKAYKSWSYTNMAPLIPGLDISVLPVLQFILLIPLSFHITRYIISK